MYMTIYIFNLIVLIAGITLLSLNYSNQTSVIFGSILIIIGLLISIISFLVYMFAKDNEPVARVIDSTTSNTDNVKIVIGIPVSET